MHISLVKTIKMYTTNLTICPKIERSKSTIVYAATRTPRELKKRRQRRARNKISGTEERPRLCVHRSNNHIYAQVIDDNKKHTLAATGTVCPELKGTLKGNNIS